MTNPLTGPDAADEMIDVRSSANFAIAVILLTAISVLLAVTVFVLVSDIGNGGPSLANVTATGSCAP